MKPSPVEIVWKDASEQMGIINPEDPQVKTFRTVGYLIKRTPEYLTIVTHIDLETGEMHHRFDVLRTMVQKVRNLGGKNDKSRMARKDARVGRGKDKPVREEER